MWETFKSIAFVLFTVMVALVLQARADKNEFDAGSMMNEATVEMQIVPALSVELE